MVTEVLNLLAAIVTTLAAIAAAVVLLGPGAPAAAIWGAILAIVGSLFWVASAIAGIIERRKPPGP
jgi:hypothetical protein